ncbi:peptidase [Amycolatopsis sp. GM8]|uniref:peptidase n=1 Tax=Amycolatopsis sp. GM8 TaxID=2896530 RepID=UPI001F282AF7|nr:peptidase [Amycolatopsis sp. GM8]
MVAGGIFGAIGLIVTYLTLGSWWLVIGIVLLVMGVINLIDGAQKTARRNR